MRNNLCRLRITMYMYRLLVDLLTRYSVLSTLYVIDLLTVHVLCVYPGKHRPVHVVCSVLYLARIYSPHTRSRTGPGGHDALASPRCVKNIPLVMVSETMAVCNVALLMAM